MEAAAKLVGEFLVPIDDEFNTHKQQQLRQLALINGTLREEGYCNICGEKGHRQFECPLRHSRESVGTAGGSRSTPCIPTPTTNDSHTHTQGRTRRCR